MITPGWKRRNDVCPQCHMPGRVGQRYARKGETVEMAEKRIGIPLLYERMIVRADLCDNCGVLYAFSASEYPRE